MTFGLFDAALASDVEVALSKQASVDKLNAAVYDVREKLGQVLFASRDEEEFKHKIAMMKEDQSLFKVMTAAGLFPIPGNVRKVVGTLAEEFRQGMRKGAPFAGYEDFDDCTSKNSDKGDSKAYCGEIKHRTEDKKESRRRQADLPGLGGGMGEPDKLLTSDDIAQVPGTSQYPSMQAGGGQQVGQQPLAPPTKASRRRQGGGTVDVKPAFEDHRGQELKPKGDFKSYLKQRSQGAESKISDNFVGEPLQEHTEDPAKHNFASRRQVDHYATWCKRQGLSPIRLSSLDRYAANLSTENYFKLANVILAWENEHHPKVPNTKLKSTDKVARRDPMTPYKAWCRKHGLRMISARNINHYAQSDPRLACYLAMRCKQAIKVARRRQATNEPMGPANSPGAATVQGQRPVVDIINSLGDPADVLGPRHQSRRRQAAPDYLQKADDALTQLLNQKAEEFQQTIAPLQQALVTVQQAEQLQQQQNPLNVLPTPGTVNVMPGQPNSTPGQLGMPDPNQPDISGLVQALQPGGGAMGGVAPQGDTPGGGMNPDAGAPPPAAAGGGLPDDLSQSAGKAARRGKGRGATRPRQAAGVGEQWDRWRKNKEQSGDALRGGDVDYEQFRNETGVGDRALNKLKQRNQNPDFEPINGGGAAKPKRQSQPQGITVGQRRRAAPGMPPPSPNLDVQAGGGTPAPGPTGLNPNMGSDGLSVTPDPTTPGMNPVASRRNACWPGCHENEAHAKKFHSKDKESRRRKASPPFDQGKHNYGDPDHPIQNPVNPYTGGGMFDDPEDLTPRTGRRKQAWTGWGPAQIQKTRHVAGWDWNDYQNGYLTNSPRHFECSCGDQFPTPSGFHRCANCGRQWNSYVIGSGGSNREASADQFIVREVPVRPDVIVASRKLAAPHERLPGGDLWPADRGSRAMSLPTGRPGPKSAPKPQPPTRSYEEIDSDIERGRRPGGPFSDEAMEKIRRGGTVRLVDRHGNIHNLVDPGEIGEGEDPGHSTFKKQPKDWARRGDGGKWTPSAIG